MRKISNQLLCRQLEVARKYAYTCSFLLNAMFNKNNFLQFSLHNWSDIVLFLVDPLCSHSVGKLGLMIALYPLKETNIKIKDTLEN